MSQIDALFNGKSLSVTEGDLDVIFDGAIAAQDGKIFISAFDYSNDQPTLCVVPSEFEKRPKNMDLKALLEDKSFLIDAFVNGQRIELNEEEAEQNLNAALIEQIQPKLAR